MHIKNMHDMIEDLTSCTKEAMRNNKSKIGDYPIGDVVDMIKDLTEAEYHATITKAMEESEYGVDYDEHGEIRHYKGQPRSATTGRYIKEYMPERDMDIHLKRMYTTHDDYTRGYEEGKKSMSRYDKARKMYEDSKGKGNPQEEMRHLENLLNTFEGELKELIPKMSQAEKNLVKNKIDAWENVV